MAYSVASKKSGKTYFLHARAQKLKGGQEVTLYYFAGQSAEGAIDALPAGYVVSENTRTGLPLLKKGPAS
jgi:YHS domain-containing protein